MNYIDPISSNTAIMMQFWLYGGILIAGAAFGYHLAHRKPGDGVFTFPLNVTLGLCMFMGFVGTLALVPTQTRNIYGGFSFFAFAAESVMKAFLLTALLTMIFKWFFMGINKLIERYHSLPLTGAVLVLVAFAGVSGYKWYSSSSVTDNIQSELDRSKQTVEAQRSELLQLQQNIPDMWGFIETLNREVNLTKEQRKILDQALAKRREASLAQERERQQMHRRRADPDREQSNKGGRRTNGAGGDRR